MYQINVNSNSLIRLDDNAVIPMDPANKDYADYLKWVDAGGITQRAEAADPKLVYQSQLDQLEQATQMNRLTREFMMVSMQDMAQRQSEIMHENGIEMSAKDILAARPGWVKLLEVDTQAGKLRELIG